MTWSFPTSCFSDTALKWCYGNAIWPAESRPHNNAVNKNRDVPCTSSTADVTIQAFSARVIWINNFWLFITVGSASRTPTPYANKPQNYDDAGADNWQKLCGRCTTARPLKIIKKHLKQRAWLITVWLMAHSIYGLRRSPTCSNQICRQYYVNLS